MRKSQPLQPAVPTRTSMPLQPAVPTRRSMPLQPEGPPLLHKDTFKDRVSTPTTDFFWAYENLNLDVSPADAPSGGAWSMLLDGRSDRQRFFDRFGRLIQKRQDNEILEAEIVAQAKIKDSEIARRLSALAAEADLIHKIIEALYHATPAHLKRLEKQLCRK